MQIIVSGKHMDVGDALKEHIETRIEAAVLKYLDKVNTVKVVISKHGQAFQVDISGNIGTHSGITIQSRADEFDPYASFDLAADKIEKQLRRYKRQLKNHHHSNKGDATVAGTKYVISADDEGEPEAANNPLIIAEASTHIEHLTVSDAVMRLDLGELPALVFINSANDRINMIYRRTDGNISWVDPDLAEEKEAAA